MNVGSTNTSGAECASKLAEIIVDLQANDDEDAWRSVELHARQLADSLRVPNGPEDYHTLLGATTLPQDLTSLLSCALNGSSVPDDAHSPAVLEILRVGANLVHEHDQNRGHILEAGFPQAIVSLLEGYAENIPRGPQEDPLPLPIIHLQIIRAAVGLLLNASLGYEPVKFRLTSLEVCMTLVRLSSAIYPAGAWMRSTKNLFPVDSADLANSSECVVESWNVRITLSDWTWRVVSELTDNGHPLFDPQVLPYLAQPLIAFMPPRLTAPLPSSFVDSSHLRTSLLQADLALLSESCSHLESLALDVEEIRLTLAHDFQYPPERDGVRCLSAMINFIEQGNYPSQWYEIPSNDGDVRRQEKAFDNCKAAVIKAIVEVSGESKEVDVLWGSSEMNSGGEFISRMVDWIRMYVTGGRNANGREDMVICATLSLGNLIRGKAHPHIVLSPPHNIAQLLSSELLLAPSTDIKLKHGVIGLLKHLSLFSPDDRVTLGNSGVIERIVASGVWDERSDTMANIVQLNAIGVVKHLCHENPDNSIKLVLPSKAENHPPSGLSQLVSLINRSNDVAIKSEGTRVIANAVNSVWSKASHEEARQRNREKAMETLLTASCTDVLAALIGRSSKHPMLINEAVVALACLGTHHNGAPLVLRSLVEPLPLEVTPSVTESIGPSSTTSVSSETGSPIPTSPATRNRTPNQRRALDQLITVLRSNLSGNGAPSPQSRSTIAVNFCILLQYTARQRSGKDLDAVKEATGPMLEEFARSPSNEDLRKAARDVLSVWTPVHI
ncbi:hypothetical protein F5I97DRAFT_1802615 [Phlebopus sp. FC_14]|nr:hypothetical protein F5I97DRAFT_1802615 [Phlebopus sp. FC_14]